MADHISSSGEGHGSVGSYLTGFVLAVILTVAAFGLVMSHAMSPSATGGAIALLAVVQIVVHLIYFLHMNGSSEQRWNVMAFTFTVLSVLVLVAGTMFIMHDTAINMMSR
ncbi:cytochrome o ubiquinol oxidase subunit IV [Komagataeibacter xylinus]|uniref:cytochrome o ubiquinol oxidase subunit IV n=1 Tax=Komagataeibacter xylinus TaxID=28448 RepID=UPI00102F74AF|nr:cytochrome o ubiquinol oxidase subunit IV [Komagataeibacter xylinus]